ncbi:unnamed protein product, partial [Phaeothamnion confervicola]
FGGEASDGNKCRGGRRRLLVMAHPAARRHPAAGFDKAIGMSASFGYDDFERGGRTRELARVCSSSGGSDRSRACRPRSQRARKFSPWRCTSCTD